MRIGEINTLRLLRITAPGAYLGDDEDNDVLLPGKYLTPEMDIDSDVDVFLYKDSEDRLVATTEKPFIQLHGFACLEVKEVNAFGAFLDWGLEKDLMVPFKEQNKKMEVGYHYLVTLQLDESTNRLFASTKLNRYIQPCEDPEITNQEVDVLVGDMTDLGLKVIVDDCYSGIIYRNDISRPLKRGDRTKGYVFNVRPDGKLDIRLEKPGFEKFDDASVKILHMLREKTVLPFSDKSDPDEIREQLGMSKKTFKQAIGQLYKKRLITIHDHAIELSQNTENNP